MNGKYSDQHDKDPTDSSFKKPGIEQVSNSCRAQA
jgi:hypothetical protein